MTLGEITATGTAIFKYVGYFPDWPIREVKQRLEAFGLIDFQYKSCLWAFSTSEQIKKLEGLGISGDLMQISE